LFFFKNQNFVKKIEESLKIFWKSSIFWPWLIYLLIN
jgi:hypothetical protein